MKGSKDQSALLLRLKQGSWIDLFVFLLIPDLDFISVLGNKKIQTFLMLVGNEEHGATSTNGIQWAQKQCNTNHLWDFNLFCVFFYKTLILLPAIP